MSQSNDEKSHNST